MPGKPTGTVYLHVSAADGYEHGERHVWESDRSGNKLLSAMRALEMIGEYLDRSLSRGPIVDLHATNGYNRARTIGDMNEPRTIGQ